MEEVEIKGQDFGAEGQVFEDIGVKGQAFGDVVISGEAEEIFREGWRVGEWKERQQI